MSKRHLPSRIARLPLQKLLLLLEAALWLFLARVALRLLPFPRIGAYVGVLQPPSTPATNYSAAETVAAQKVAQAVNATAVNSPLEMVCLPRALAAWQMLHLRRVPARLHFGKPLVGEGLGGERQMHAWLSSAGVEVTGYPVAYRCVELGYFSRRVPGAASV